MRSFQPPLEPAQSPPDVPAPIPAPYRPQKHTKWTDEQVAPLRALVASYGPIGKWQDIAGGIPGRDHGSCSAKWVQLNSTDVRGKWSAAEDENIRLAVTRVRGDDQENEIDRDEVAERVPGRSRAQFKSAREERLDPTLTNGKWTDDEDQALELAFNKYPYKWAQIAQEVPRRTQRQCRPRFFTLCPLLKQ
ncbi:hypothetical protein BDK51DRAFT_18289 [Blyttiomyces helicus]|uniref:Homeodomain-like protein n=1 Tax=Blyttiomyces helicus TaxID=388810 RepID=A0A4P9WBI8_9FUNG|nr:hypothetical protein BDK51DRAFT_18289 [Blyttiomyces helicus]|eukprot:RKO87656.1 hypothetical protein BDK51DRAFT_18289 [Blyttiomyces helicus]